MCSEKTRRHAAHLNAAQGIANLKEIVSDLHRFIDGDSSDRYFRFDANQGNQCFCESGRELRHVKALIAVAVRLERRLTLGFAAAGVARRRVPLVTKAP